jgi:mediator of RNA polymerase II transcription subunit 13
MKASELARGPPRASHPPAPHSASTSSPSTSGMLKGQPAAGARAHNQLAPQEIFAIYELFTASVVALLSYYLVRDYGAVALNFRTLLSQPETTENSREIPSGLALPFRMTSLNVYCTSSGSLVVSAFSVTKPEIRCLNEAAGTDEQKQIIGKCIRIAPNGSLAQVMSFDDPLGTVRDGSTQRVSKRRFKISPAEQALERWKSSVERWMSGKGYSTSGLDRKTSWVRIRLAQRSNATTFGFGLANHSREILWPQALCFFYDDSFRAEIRMEAATKLEPDVDWFQTESSFGFRDPLDVAQLWFHGKTEREISFNARRKVRQAEEDAARLREEQPGGLFPSSPLNARTGVYDNLQAATGAGVYPTPPDGILPGVAVSTGDTSSISGIATNTVLAPGGTNPAINVSAPQESQLLDEGQPSTTSPEFMQFDQFNSSGGNDDLFEDMDADDFGGNGVTDADFNFFDEPDEDDVDMLDSLAAMDNRISATKRNGKKKDQELFPAVEVKEESSDPLAALENALASASDSLSIEIRDVEMKDEEDAKVSIENSTAEPIEPQVTFQREQPPTTSIGRRLSPPLSPARIKHDLLSPLERQKAPQQDDDGPHRDSIFDAVSFNRRLSLTDAKYHDGHFSFPDTKNSKPKRIAEISTKRPASLRDIPLITKLRYAVGIAARMGVPEEVEALTRMDSDFTDSSSEVSEILDEDSDELLSLPPESQSAGIIVPSKRKLPTDGNATPMSTTSFAESLGGDIMDMVALQTDESSLALFEASYWDWPLTIPSAPMETSAVIGRYDIPTFPPLTTSLPNTPTSQPDLEFPDEKPLSGKDSIAVAQIVTEQTASATLDILCEDTYFVSTPRVHSGVDVRLQGIVKKIFTRTYDCTVSGLISIPDTWPDLPPHMKGQQRPPPRRPNESLSLPSSQVHYLTQQYIRVRRAESLWDVLPPALPLWDSLGLSPCSSPKNVVSFCVYPYSDSLIPCLEQFLINMQIAYESCKLGNHTRADGISGIGGGLVPCKLTSPSSTRIALKALRETCTALGKLLATNYMQLQEKDSGQKIAAFVIYIVDPFQNASALWELCSAFWSLFQAYGQGGPGRPDSGIKPDLVLQIVPIKNIASFDSPVILDSSTYASLAREVYDRCPPSAPCEDKTPLRIYAAPSFQLEETVPRLVPFKLVADPPQDLLRENSYMHIAYATSLDGAWMTVAWTDSWGKSRAVVSYHLGTRPFAEIAKEVWSTTTDIIQVRKVIWRVCIAKAGVVERDEAEIWINLSLHSTAVGVFVSLISVDTNPPFSFTPTMASSSAQAANPSANAPGGSTPQAGVSPDMSGLTPAATPSAENAPDPSTDPSARLVDVTDEAWAVILSHRLHNSNSTTEFRPALISGFLVKRGLPSPMTNAPPSTPDPECGPVILGVNIVWVGAVNSARAATSPFPVATDGVSPGGAGITSTAGGGVPQSPVDRPPATTSLMYVPVPGLRVTAEILLKEILVQYRGLGTLARLMGIRGTRMGVVPWHVVVAMRGAEGLRKVLS